MKIITTLVTLVLLTGCQSIEKKIVYTPLEKPIYIAPVCFENIATKTVIVTKSLDKSLENDSQESTKISCKTVGNSFIYTVNVENSPIDIIVKFDNKTAERQLSAIVNEQKISKAQGKFVKEAFDEQTTNIDPLSFISPLFFQNLKNNSPVDLDSNIEAFKSSIASEENKKNFDTQLNIIKNSVVRGVYFISGIKTIYIESNLTLSYQLPSTDKDGVIYSYKNIIKTQNFYDIKTGVLIKGTGNSKTYSQGGKIIDQSTFIDLVNYNI